VDTDDLIETAEKRKIKEIFKQQGEPAFRALEARWARWLERSVRGAVISTGGGFFMAPNLRAIGTVVLLEASLDDILAVIRAHPQAAKKIRKRPLLADMDAAQALYTERLPRYRAVADLVVQVGRGDVAGAAETIITALDLPRR
jgi:shikimate kinase